jgi:uncharacterized protein (TIGR02646 family)
MRNIQRLPLIPATQNALQKKQESVNQKRLLAGFNAIQEWKISRRLKSICTVLVNLKRMAGKRERCMYCDDSHGSDIEHFWPKTPYPQRMFIWENLLLCCTECGRIKGELFPLDAGGAPLLIDPSIDNPWNYLEFDSQTGNITAKYDLQTNGFSPKGENTVSILHLNSREAMASSYLRSLKRIKNTVIPYISGSAGTPDFRALLKNLRLADENGLLDWCFKYSGKEETPFKEFICKYPEVSKQIADTL